MKILLFGENEKLEKVLKFWRLEYTIVPRLTEPFWRCEIKETIREPTVFVSNCLPSLKFWKKVYEEPDKSHMSPISTEILGGKWSEVFCIYLNVNEFFEIDPQFFTCESNYITKDYDDPLLFDIGVRPNLKVAWDMSSKFWYSLSSVLSREIFLPLWIHEVQLEFLEKGSVDDYNGIISQAVFSRAYNYEKRSGTIKDAINYIKSVKNLKDNGVLFEVRERFGKHSLTLPGMVMIENKDNSLIPNSNFTLVGHFYDLKIEGKPRSNYIISLQKYCKIRHPIIFYGDEEICQEFLKLRTSENLEAFTKIVPGKIEDWSIWNPNYKYQSTTLLKPYILMDAIEKNPFLSEYYAYMDPGIYKHQAFQGGDFVDIRLFDNISLFGDKLRMQKFGNPSTSDSEITQETILCGIMIGNSKAWKNTFPKFDEFVSKLEVYLSEQQVMTRLATLYPEFFDLIHGGLDKRHYLNFFEL